MPTPIEPDLTPKKAAWLTGYRDVKSFIANAEKTGLTIARHNSRVFRIDPQDFRKWKESRSA